MYVCELYLNHPSVTFLHESVFGPFALLNVNAAIANDPDFLSYSYECDCEDTGFLGDHCEEDIPECASDPCQHGATCLEGVKEYTCLCWPGMCTLPLPTTFAEMLSNRVKKTNTKLIWCCGCPCLE